MAEKPSWEDNPYNVRHYIRDQAQQTRNLINEAGRTNFYIAQVIERLDEIDERVNRMENRQEQAIRFRYAMIGGLLFVIFEFSLKYL